MREVDEPEDFWAVEMVVATWTAMREFMTGNQQDLAAHVLLRELNDRTGLALTGSPPGIVEAAERGRAALSGRPTHPY